MNGKTLQLRKGVALKYSEYGEHLHRPCDVNIYLKLMFFVHNIVIICRFLESTFYNLFLASALSYITNNIKCIMVTLMFLGSCGYSTVCVCMISVMLKCIAISN